MTDVTIANLPYKASLQDKTLLLCYIKSYLFDARQLEEKIQDSFSSKPVPQQELAEFIKNYLFFNLPNLLEQENPSLIASKIIYASWLQADFNLELDKYIALFIETRCKLLPVISIQQFIDHTSQVLAFYTRDDQHLLFALISQHLDTEDLHCIIPWYFNSKDYASQELRDFISHYLLYKSIEQLEQHKLNLRFAIFWLWAAPGFQRELDNYISKYLAMFLSYDEEDPYNYEVDLNHGDPQWAAEHYAENLACELDPTLPRGTSFLLAQVSYYLFTTKAEDLQCIIECHFDPKDPSEAKLTALIGYIKEYIRQGFLEQIRQQKFTITTGDLQLYWVTKR